MTTLNQYEMQLDDLLHDPNNQVWTQAQLDRYINEARRRTVKDTGCLRSLQTCYLFPGVEQYSFGQVTGAVINAGGTNYSAPAVSFSGGGGSGVAATLTQSGGAVNAISFSSFGSGYTTAPVATVTDGGAGTEAQIVTGVINFNTYDVISISVVWGSERYQLDWYPFSHLSKYIRTWLSANYQRQPVAWGVYGENQVFISPPPDQPYLCELDTIILPTDLTDYVTNDPIPVVNQDCIKFYAAYLAKFNNEAYGEAEIFKNEYNDIMLNAQAAYTRRIPSV